MADPDYQKIADTLVANAGKSSQEQSLNDQTLFDSVEKLCLSSKGGQFFVEAAENIVQQSTKNRLIASLNWVSDSSDAEALAMESKIELVKPFQLAAIGLTVANFIWIIQNFKDSGIDIYFLVMLILSVALITIVRNYFTKIRDANRIVSNRTNSLLDTVRSYVIREI